FLMGIVFLGIGPRRKVYEESFTLTPPARGDQTQVVFSGQPFELRARQNIAVTAQANLDNSWVDIEGDLVNEDSGYIQTFLLPLSYYHGTDGGESWTEGARAATTYLSALPDG